MGSSTEAGVIPIETGLVRGHREQATWAYRGIPYAAPPMGDLRWKPPAPEILTAGEHNRVLFAIGTNRDEFAKGLAVTVTTAQEYESVINASFGPLAPQVLSAYPVGDYATPREALVAVYSLAIP